MPELTASQGLLRLATGFGISVALWWLVYRVTRSPAGDPDDMSQLEHAEEIRRRLLRAAFGLFFWIAVFLGFRFDRFWVAGVPMAAPAPDVYANAAAAVFDALADHVLPDGVQVIVTRPTEAVAAQMTLGLVMGVFLSMPMMMHELWAFFAPAMRPMERRLALATVPAAILLFVAGALFALAYVVPLLFDVLYRFATPLGAVLLVSAASLVSGAAVLLLVFGLAFELPLVMAALSAMGIVSPGTWLRKWRHATVAVFLVAALATDPSLVSQLVVGACLLTLYWVGVVAAHLVHRRPA